ncbi:uncharacterized protein PG998_014063 [Apiospora kogelbergensis]|uniref:uncharacterized protein n=1 Tax=Apiospora kogelbergensis TaxID=1337665 RepID=UPI00312EE82C
MEGFVVVKLMSNNTFDGTLSALKAPEIDNVYTVIEPQSATPDYHRFYGVWTWVLFTSVVWWPLLAWIVSSVRKWFIDRQHAARVNPARAPTPPPRDNDGFELQPVGGVNVPAVSAAPAVPARPLQAWKASLTEQALVMLWLCLWRGILMAMQLQQIVFQVTLLPWMRSAELRDCMLSEWKGMYLPAYSIVFAVFASVGLVYQLVSAAVRVFVDLDTMRTHEVYVEFEFEPPAPLMFLVSTSGLICLAFAACTHYFKNCASGSLYADLTVFSLSALPLIAWYGVDRFFRFAARHYQFYWGFPDAPRPKTGSSCPVQHGGDPYGMVAGGWHKPPSSSSCSHCFVAIDEANMRRARPKAWGGALVLFRPWLCVWEYVGWSYFWSYLTPAPPDFGSTPNARQQQQQQLRSLFTVRHPISALVLYDTLQPASSTDFRAKLVDPEADSTYQLEDSPSEGTGAPLSLLGQSGDAAR